MPLTLEELTERMGRGAQIEDLAKEMSWRDFEWMVSEVFLANGHRSFLNFRFSSNKRRYEVDVVAVCRPRILLVDCKHWGMRLGKPSALRIAAKAQSKRGREFRGKLQELDIGLGDWSRAIIIPMLVTLYQEGVVECDGAWIVPLFKLNSFLEGIRNGIFDGEETKVPASIATWMRASREPVV